MSSGYVHYDFHSRRVTARMSVMIITCLLFASLISGVAIAEYTPDSLSWPQTATDDQGVTISLEKIPERIVSLAPSNTELLFALGLGDRIVGVTDYCNYPEKATTIEKIGGFSTVSIEKVTAMQPDLVFAAEGNNPDTVQRIRSLGIPVYLVDVSSMDGILKTLKTMGSLTGSSSQASDLVANLTERSEQIRAEGESISNHPTIAHVIWNDPLYVSGGKTFQDELIRISGGKNAFEDKESHHIASVEEFLTKNPDILIINSGSGMGGNNSDIATWFKDEPRLSGLQAVRENHIILVDADRADRAGPRLWDLLEEIAPQIRAMA